MKNLQINTEKLRIVTRCDIHPGAQIAQSNHATAKFAKEHPEKFNNWIEKSEYIALLEIKDEWSLLALADKLLKRGVVVSVFYEPDLNGEATSIAIENSEIARKQTSHLKLAFSDYYEFWEDMQRNKKFKLETQ